MRLLARSPTRKTADGRTGQTGFRSTSGPATPIAARQAAYLALIFFCLVGLGIAHHEPWRDELQAWMLARDSASVPALLHNMRYERHPAGWHLALFVLSRFTRDAVAMQLLHLVLATAVVYVVARFSPFSTVQKVLLAFGYFFFYQYAVISRGYVIGALALFTFCALFPGRRRSYLPLAATLAVLANTSVYGLLLALAAGAALLFEWVVDADLRRSLLARKWDLAASATLFAVSAVAAVMQMLPPADTPPLGDVPLQKSSIWDPARAAESMSTVWNAFTLVWGATIDRLVETHLGAGVTVLTGLRVLFSIGVIAAAALLFARTPVALFLYAVGTGTLLLFMHLVFYGFIRHHGHHFLLFVACLWLAAHATQGWRVPQPLDRLSRRVERARNGLFTAVLIVQLPRGAVSYVRDLYAPFTAAKAAAAFIERSEIRDLPLIGSRRVEVSTVAGYLDREIYYLEEGRSGTYVVWAEPRMPDTVEVARAVEPLPRLLSPTRPKALLILSYPMPARRPSGLAVTELARFTQSIEPSERYYIYLVERVRARATSGSPSTAPDRRGTSPPPHARASGLR